MQTYIQVIAWACYNKGSLAVFSGRNGPPLPSKGRDGRCVPVFINLGSSLDVDSTLRGRTQGVAEGLWIWAWREHDDEGTKRIRIT